MKQGNTTPTSNVHVFPTGKVLKARKAAPEAADDYRPQSLSDGIRFLVIAELRTSPLKLIGQLFLIAGIFVLLIALCCLYSR
jgi:hypothetical protein